MKGVTCVDDRGDKGAGQRMGCNIPASAADAAEPTKSFCICTRSPGPGAAAHVVTDARSGTMGTMDKPRAPPIAASAVAGTMVHDIPLAATPAAPAIAELAPTLPPRMGRTGSLNGLRGPMSSSRPSMPVALGLGGW